MLSSLRGPRVDPDPALRGPVSFRSGPDRLIHQAVETLAELELAGGIDLGHHDADHLMLGIDPEIRVVDPTPTEGADRILGIGARLSGHAEAIAEAESVHGNPERQSLDLIAGHGSDRLGPEDP